MANETNKQFEKVLSVCRELFSKKLYDYGASWRIMRPESLITVLTPYVLIMASESRCSIEMLTLCASLHEVTKSSTTTAAAVVVCRYLE